MAGVVDALASYIQNMLMQLVAEEVLMLLGVSSEINNMGIKLRDLKNFLADADRRNIIDQSVQVWVIELKNAMYEATNILDLCQLKAMERGPRHDAGCFNPLLFCIQNPLHAHDIGSRIKNLNKKLEDIKARAASFHFINLGTYENSGRNMISYGSGTRETSGGLFESGLVGENIEEDTTNLVEMLTKRYPANKRESNKIMVFSIVGVGGIGKTTLAQKIFNHEVIKQEFQKKIWLSVNQHFNDNEMLRRVIIEAGGNLHSCENLKVSLEQTLIEALKGQKTLLIMDDVWDSYIWEGVLRTPFVNAMLAEGSSVLITTRHDTVALEMKAEQPYHRIDKLGYEDAWLLLKKQVVRNENNDELKVNTLKDIGMLIISKCDGLPLAIKVMGGILRQKNTRRSDWENVLKDSTWSVSQMPEELNYSVYLSYQDLNPVLKSCFLHYALLPKGTMFINDSIVAMWISEGFVHGNSQDLEVLGKEYYDQLIARNLLELDQNYTADHAVCNMHDIVRSFARYLIRDEALTTHKSEDGGSIDPQNIIQLSLKVKESESSKLAWSSLQAYISLRTLILVGEIKINPDDSLSNFPCLRTLHIEDGNFDALSESLDQLKHLRYLFLGGTDTSRLPEKIAKMKLLQYIDLSNCRSLMKLPSGIGKLRQLRYLSLPGLRINNIPRGLGGLTNLRILKGFPAHVEGDWCSLEELGSLNRLMHLCICGLENVSSSSFAKKARLCEKVHLSYLSLEITSGCGGEEEQQHIEQVFEELCPPFGLENLKIKGYFGQRLPMWMMTSATALFGRLSKLVMEDLPYCPELPDGLCQLPSLEFLQIEFAAINHVGPEFLLPHNQEHPSTMENISSDLEIQVIKCSGLESISSLPKLQNLRIIYCPELKVLEGLPALQRLTLEDYGMETLPGYLKAVNPRFLDLDCDLSLLAAIAKGKSGPEWDKFSHIKQVNAYAHDDEWYANNIQRKWYVKYTRDPFSFKTNISHFVDNVSGDETEEVLLEKVDEISRDEIEEEE